MTIAIVIQLITIDLLRIQYKCNLHYKYILLINYSCLMLYIHSTYYIYIYTYSYMYTFKYIGGPVRSAAQLGGDPRKGSESTPLPVRLVRQNKMYNQ